MNLTLVLFFTKNANDQKILTLLKLEPCSILQLFINFRTLSLDILIDCVALKKYVGCSPTI